MILLKLLRFLLMHTIIFFGVPLGVLGLFKLEIIIKEKIKSKRCKNTTLN